RFSERFSLGRPVSVAQRVAPTLAIAVAVAVAVAAADSDTAAAHSFTEAQPVVDVRGGRGQPVHEQRRATPAGRVDACLRHTHAAGALVASGRKPCAPRAATGGWLRAWRGRGRNRAPDPGRGDRGGL